MNETGDGAERSGPACEKTMEREQSRSKEWEVMERVWSGEPTKLAAQISLNGNATRFIFV